LTVICSKNPTETLIENIDNLILYYPDFDIVIIDGDSKDKSIYSKINKKCIVEYTTNNNYELGAWKYAFNKYNYKNYMFIQDTLIPTERIPNLEKNIEKNIIYTFDFEQKINDITIYHDIEEYEYMDILNIYKNTQFDFLSNLDLNQKINVAAHSSFIANKKISEYMLHLEDPYIKNNISKTKTDSILAERTCGIIANKFERIDANPYFKKIHGNRI
jgi:hypothetical protein